MKIVPKRVAVKFALTAALCAGLSAGLSVPASAQVLGLGSTKGGATAQVTKAIASVVSAHSGMQMRTQPMGGTQQYIPIVNAGELEFGVSNMMQANMAVNGTGLSKRKHENLRMVATLMTFRVGFLVANNAGIANVAALKGKRVASGFKSAPLFQFMSTGYLKNGGLSWDDVTKVPMVGLRQHWTAFKQGKLDVVVAAVGSGPVKDMNANTEGGITLLSFERDTAGAAAMLQYLPKTYYIDVKPNPKLVGVGDSPKTVMAFDYALWVHKDVADEVVYKVSKALYDNEKALHATSPLWRSHRSARMAKDQGLAYHPGALKFYREVGIAAK